VYEHNITGTDVFARDWDNLIVLDACRYDMFAGNHNLSGSLDKIQSSGSNTPEWLRHNLSGKDLSDTVYVTANPMFYRIHDTINYTRGFHRVINIWQEDGWDDRYNTVLPETTTKYAIEAENQFPDKRLFVHFIQPHFPFISDNLDLRDILPDPKESDGLWDQIRSNQIDASTESIWEAYTDTLKRVLPSVSKLIKELTGKTVVTADHGNMIRERGSPLPIVYSGHPQGIYTDELVDVPWMIHEGEERKEIVSGGSQSPQGEVTDEVVTDRLRQLGYIE
jgi:hypothetical protein